MTGRVQASEGVLATVYPNLRHLRLLDVAIAQGSLTQAAGLVHISQPAASQAMARLGQVFGARMLERAGNSVIPTTEGEIVVRRARRALMHLRATVLGGRARRTHDRAVLGDVLERYASTAQLRAIVSFAATGSFAAAARGLGQAQSSVQRACRDIERIVGLPLFEGGQRKRLLTAAGARVAGQASLALKEMMTAHAELRERAGVFDSHLVIGALPLARTRLVPQSVVRLMARYPAARIEIIDGAYDTLVQKLRFGTCDLIIGALRGPVLDDGLQEQALFTDTLCVVARAGHPLSGRQVRGPELAQYPWILPRSDAPARQVFEQLAARHGLHDPARGHVETGSLVALRGILLASDALTLISLAQIDYEYMQGLLAPLDFPVEGGERTIGVTSLSSALPNRMQAGYLNLLVEASADVASPRAYKAAQGL